MVRNIVQLMFFIGKGLEEPSIIDTLFDITSTPRKPNYKMAADYPLVLHKCDFNDLRLRSGAANLGEVQMNLEGRWERLAIRAEHLKNQIESLGEENEVEVEVREKASRGANNDKYVLISPPLTQLASLVARRIWRGSRLKH